MRDLDLTEQRVIEAIASTLPVSYQDLELIYQKTGSYDATIAIVRIALKKDITLREALDLYETLQTLKL
jgi:glycosyltransferase involved in cell wall biosynthesis